jgi:polygalacturonase
VVHNWCDNVIIYKIKLIGLWRNNTDGIHPENSKNMTIKNCFVRAFDDAIVFSRSGTATTSAISATIAQIPAPSIFQDMTARILSVIFQLKTILLTVKRSPA